MKIAINTNYKSAGTKVCVDDLGHRLEEVGNELARNDWQNYEKYDLILFMSPDSDVLQAKKANPKLLVGLMDPKITKRRIPQVKSADFLLVSSIEQRDFFLKYNSNIFIYYMFPLIREIVKEHEQKQKIIIGYHGNKTHLNCMRELSLSLDRLSRKYDIEFWAIYNIKSLGMWNRNRPKKCLVKDIQWSEDVYSSHLSKCDIGVIPAKMPVSHRLSKVCSRPRNSFLKNWGNYSQYDYLIRFKYSNNPGRIYPFSQLHIPVVSDFTPSYCQIIQDSYSGFLVWSEQGWSDALEKLIIDQDLRNKMSKNLKDFIDNNFSPDTNFNKFLEFIDKQKTGDISKISI